MTSTPAQILAAFAQSDVQASDEALAFVRMSCLDWASVGAAGIDEPVARTVRTAISQEGGTPQASVLGCNTALPARAAALINGTISHALDYDDTHFAHIGHPSVVVWSATLAAAQSISATRNDTNLAALMGAEASVRVGLWLGRAHYEAGFHQTATAGAFGAAVAAARLLDLSQLETEHALNILATRASGLKSQFGTMGKPYNAGQAAAAGIEATILAGQGMTGPTDGLGGIQGFGPTHAGIGDMSAFDGMGDKWVFPTINYKFHACCHGIHAALEAVGDYVGPATIKIHPRWAKVCAIPAPATGLEAKFSVTHAVAMHMAGHDTAALSTYSDAMCRDAAVLALRGDLTLAYDADLPDTAARIETPSGALRHDLSDPVQRTQLEERLWQKSQSLLGADRAKALRDALDAHDMPKQVGAWMAGLAR